MSAFNFLLPGFEQLQKTWRHERSRSRTRKGPGRMPYFKSSFPAGTKLARHWARTGVKENNGYQAIYDQLTGRHGRE